MEKGAFKIDFEDWIGFQQMDLQTMGKLKMD